MSTKSSCPDCGTAFSQPHHNECDIERCSTCGGHRTSCDCATLDPSQSNWTDDLPEFALNDEQIARQDHVDNAVHSLLVDLADRDLEWDFSLIGKVRECIGEELHRRGIMTEMEFYPFVESPEYELPTEHDSEPESSHREESLDEAKARWDKAIGMTSRSNGNQNFVYCSPTGFPLAIMNLWSDGTGCFEASFGHPIAMQNDWLKESRP